jgi:hypothetical protein
MTHSGKKAKKPKKPPVDKEDVRARLQRARERQLLVRVRRWIPGSDRLEGFVVGVGARWVLLQRLSDQITFDGWQLVRCKDVQAVSVEPDDGSFQVRALRARGLWPPGAPALDPARDVGGDGGGGEDVLGDTAGVVASLAKAAPLLAVFDEFAAADAFAVGAVVSVDSDRLRLMEVNPRGVWVPKPRAFDLGDVTRLEVGGGYLEALRLVAGPPPAP